MSRLTTENLAIAKEIISRFPRPRSATLPLLHLAQEQDGYVADDAIVHIAELVGASPAEVLGTCSFYEMFKRQPVGRYLVNVCTNVSCYLMGSEDLIEHAEQRLGIKVGSTTSDGMFTLEGVECVAACTEAPCLQVNYRYFTRVSDDDFDRIVDDLATGRLDSDVPEHGTLARVRQHIPEDRRAGSIGPERQGEPAWMQANEAPKSVSDGEGKP